MRNAIIREVKKEVWLLNLNATVLYLMMMIASSPAYGAPIASSASSLTDPIQGRAPTASVALDPPSPTAGNTVSVSWVYNDADGDAQGSSTVELLLGDEAVPLTDGKFKLPVETATTAAGKTLEARGTPRSVDTAYPAQGLLVTRSVTVKGKLVPLFTRPGLTLLSWAQASAFCTDMKKRLPSVDELQALYLDGTSATSIRSNINDMCEIHGWPLDNRICGDKTGSAYWSNVSVGYHTVVSLRTGGTGTSTSPLDSHYVTCIDEGGLPSPDLFELTHNSLGYMYLPDGDGPETSDAGKLHSWSSADDGCKKKGDGWRLPGVHELTAISGPGFKRPDSWPSGHTYWSSDAWGTGQHKTVYMAGGSVGEMPDTSHTAAVCVKAASTS